MWQGKGSATKIRKHHWLLEQKLLNFVDAFHQYVMDRVMSDTIMIDYDYSIIFVEVIYVQELWAK